MKTAQTNISAGALPRRLRSTSGENKLGNVERKIKRAAKLVDMKQHKTLEVMRSAQDDGIRISVNEEYDALVKAQRALRLAELKGKR